MNLNKWRNPITEAWRDVTTLVLWPPKQKGELSRIELRKFPLFQFTSSQSAFCVRPIRLVSRIGANPPWGVSSGPLDRRIRLATRCFFCNAESKPPLFRGESNRVELWIISELQFCVFCYVLLLCLLLCASGLNSTRLHFLLQSARRIGHFIMHEKKQLNSTRFDSPSG